MGLRQAKSSGLLLQEKKKVTSEARYPSFPVLMQKDLQVLLYFTLDQDTHSYSLHVWIPWNTSCILHFVIPVLRRTALQTLFSLWLLFLSKTCITVPLESSLILLESQNK